MDVPALHGPAAEPAWPALSADDLRRLRFLVYLHKTGHIRPPAPIRPEVDALCTALFREPPAPRATTGQPGVARLRWAPDHAADSGRCPSSRPRAPGRVGGRTGDVGGLVREIRDIAAGGCGQPRLPPLPLCPVGAPGARRRLDVPTRGCVGGLGARLPSRGVPAPRTQRDAGETGGRHRRTIT